MQIKATDKSGKSIIYASAAEAATALKVDPSNISKVLRGVRPTAGGYSFTKTLERPTTAAGRRTLKQKKETAERKELVKAVHDRLKILNEKFRTAKKENFLETDKILQKQMAHSQYFGQTKTGGYNISIANLKKYSSDELQNLLIMLDREQKKYTRQQTQKQKATSMADIAAIFGISQPQIQEYDYILPALFDLLHLAKIDEFFRYSDVQTAIWDVMQKDVDPEQLEKYIDTMYDAYLGNRSEDLDSILYAMDQYAKDPAYVDPY